MASLTRRANQNSYIWPGFVDSLATLLMVVMFLLLVFVLAQFFMGQALTGRDLALSNLKTQIGELAELLSLERRENKEIRNQLSQLSQELQVSTNLQDNLKTTLSDLRKRYDNASETIKILQAQASAMRSNNDRLLSEQNKLQKENATSIDRNTKLQALNTKIREDLSNANLVISKQVLELTNLANDIARLNALKLELENEISSLGKELWDRQSQISSMSQELTKSKDEITSLSKSIKRKDDDLSANKSELDEVKSSFLKEKQLSKSALAEVALLNQQMLTLRRQLANLESALKTSEKDSKEKEAQISALGNRLNIALANKVHELSKYRSEFFGRLRILLGERQDVRIVGDRFVFQSEVLFAKGASELGLIGREGLEKLAKTLLELSIQIPSEIDWVLRIDGHTDNDPIKTPRHPSNWELSTSRAISVLKYLIQVGLPPGRLVAAGFGQHHPLDNRSDEIGKRRNRRIEIKLTQR